MRYAKKSPEELQALRRTLVSRLVQEQPPIPVAARWIRESLGLNQGDFAKLVGLSKPQVARLERGETNPTLDTLLAVGKPFGLTLGFCHPDQVTQNASTDPLPVPPYSVVSPPPSEPFLRERGPRSSAFSRKVPKLSFDKKRPKE